MTVEFAMPFYGDPDLFKAAVESVRAQNDPDWRLIVVDDQYPDDAPGKWVSSLGDARIQYLRNPENLGVSGNFRRCVELLSAELVTIIGCDDIVRPSYVGRMHELARRFPIAAYFQPGVQVIGASGDPIRPLPDMVKSFYAPRGVLPRSVGGQELATSLARACWTYFPSICWRRSTLITYPFDSHLQVALDLDLQLRIAEARGAVAIDDRVTFEYRRHDKSVSAWSANDGSRFLEEREVLERAAARARELGWGGTRRAARIRLSSRLSAATRLLPALRSRDGRGLRLILRHVFS